MRNLDEGVSAGAVWRFAEKRNVRAERASDQRPEAIDPVKVRRMAFIECRHDETAGPVRIDKRDRVNAVENRMRGFAGIIGPPDLIPAADLDAGHLLAATNPARYRAHSVLPLVREQLNGVDAAAIAADQPQIDGSRHNGGSEQRGNHAAADGCGGAPGAHSGGSGRGLVALWQGHAASLWPGAAKLPAMFVAAFMT